METKDLNCAAYFMAKEIKLKDCLPDQDQRFWFIFTDDDNLEVLRKEYYLNTGFVKPQDFINAQKTLKNLIRNFKTSTKHN